MQLYTRSNKLNVNPGICQLIIRRLSFHSNHVYYGVVLLLQTPKYIIRVKLFARLHGEQLFLLHSLSSMLQMLLVFAWSRRLRRSSRISLVSRYLPLYKFNQISSWTAWIPKPWLNVQHTALIPSNQIGFWVVAFNIWNVNYHLWAFTWAHFLTFHC